MRFVPSQPGQPEELSKYACHSLVISDTARIFWAAKASAALPAEGGQLAGWPAGREALLSPPHNAQYMTVFHFNNSFPASFVPEVFLVTEQGWIWQCGRGKTVTVPSLGPTKQWDWAYIPSRHRHTEHTYATHMYVYTQLATQTSTAEHTQDSCKYKQHKRPHPVPLWQFRMKVR